MIASSKRIARGPLGSALLVAFALTVPMRARAEPPREPPTEAQVEAARALYREARELHKQGKLKEAIDRALEAYRVAATPVTAHEAGTLLVEAGRLVEARDLLRAVALLPVSPRESDKGREARQTAASLAASLDARIPKIAIAERPRGADVVLDGKPLAGDANAWQGVDPGAHTIIVRIGDRTCATISATLAEGDERTIDLHDATKSCAVETVATPAITPTPKLPPPLARIAPPKPPPPPPPIATNDATLSTRRWAGVPIGGVGVLAIAAGGVIAVTAKSDYDAQGSSCPPRGCTQAAFDARESARSRADVATVAMLVGGAAAVGGAVLFFWPTDAPDARASVAVSGTGLRVTIPF
jgi:hypothetical protein